MNKSVPFGYHAFTLGYFVKLNVKLRAEDSKLLEQHYNGVAAIRNGDFGYRIEGVVTNAQMPDFVRSLEMMKVDYKIESLMNKKQVMLDKAITNKTINTLEESLFPF
jgi:hypothetical protein